MKRLLAAWLLGLLFLPPSAGAERLLGVHSEEPAPTIGALLATLQADDRTIGLRSFDSSAQVLAALQSGEVDLGIVEDSGLEALGISLVAELYPSVLHMLHRDGTQPGDVGGLLESGPIWAGAPGSIGHRVAENLGEDFGLDDSALRLLPEPWSVEPDIYFVFGGILAPDAISRLQGFRLFSLDDPTTLMHGSVAEGVALRYPYLRPFVLPAQLYPSLGEAAALTLAVSNILVARSDLDTQAAYELAMGVDHLAPRIAAIYPMASLPQLNGPENHARAMPLHVGAQRYRDRDLPGFLERYAEVLGLGATLVIAAGSLVVAWGRHRRQARKDTLDRYYQDLLDLRKTLDSGKTDAGDIYARVRETQAEVMALVIQERIDADGSLLAFLALSNRLLDEAAGPA